MNGLSLPEALSQACAVVGIEPPTRRLTPGQWVRTNTKGKNGKDDAAVLIHDDMKGGVVWNHQTAANHTFRIGSDGVTGKVQTPWRDPAREREQEAQRVEVERICAVIVKGCREDRHAYFDKKGFPDELGLVCDDPAQFFPRSRFGEALARALPEGGGPFLVIPGRVAGKLTTVQFITVQGVKKNILRGVMAGACHRIAMGRDTWVCEGIGTALTVRAALKLLGASATVLSAFSASNVGKVAEGISGARIAADNDKPVETLDGKGAGEFYARKSGRKWIMPQGLGDFNDMHEREGLRAVALRIREVMG